MESLGFDIRQEAVLQTLTDDAVTTSQIEGENLDADQVRSSVGRRPGMETAGIVQPDRQVEGVVEMTVNGRVGRALADMLLARSEGTSQRFYSMSAQICLERSDYYGALERTQEGTMDVTKWMLWFLGCLGRAIDGARVKVAAALRKARVWETARTASLDPRQQRMLNRLLNGFKGNLTASKWARMAKRSQDTALRDIIALVARGILERSDAGGRSTSYAIASRFA